MHILHDLQAAAECDVIAKLINYGSLSKRVLVSIEDSLHTFCSLEQLADHIFNMGFGAFAEIQHVTIDGAKPSVLPYGNAICVISSQAHDRSRLSLDRFAIWQLSCNNVIGLNPCEREDKQLVCFNVVMTKHSRPSPNLPPFA